MSTTAPTSPRLAIPPKFDNGQEWHHELGDIPLSRVVFDPWPGTATEGDLLVFVERDKRLVELIDGTLVEKPVGFDESYIALLISTAINNFIMPRRLGILTGEAGMMRLAFLGRVRLPDVSFVSFDRLPGRKVPREPIPTLAPDLAIEVLSDSNTKSEIDQKLKEYFGSGTRLAWLVDPPTRTVAIYHSPAGPHQTIDINGSVDGGDVLPGFSMRVADMFVNLDSD